jgi:hypothetical protein
MYFTAEIAENAEFLDKIDTPCRFETRNETLGTPPRATDAGGFAKTPKNEEFLFQSKRPFALLRIEDCGLRN